MTGYVCVTCGTQFLPSKVPPEHCLVCEDDRQYVGWDGQQWTTLEALRQAHTNRIADEEAGLTGIATEPQFAIGQRSLLVKAPDGNVLWDCISLLDQATISALRARGGIRAIAISHPHFYASMVEWSRAFEAPIYLHEADRQWVMRPDPAICFWTGDKLELGDGLTLIRCGGHFPGGTVLHWGAGAGGQGVLLTGDIIDVAQDRRWVSFMYSFPNKIPLSAAAVQRIAASVDPWPFERIYGAWWGRVVANDAKKALVLSAERYVRAIS